MFEHYSPYKVYDTIQLYMYTSTNLLEIYYITNILYVENLRTLHESLTCRDVQGEGVGILSESRGLVIIMRWLSRYKGGVVYRGASTPPCGLSSMLKHTHGQHVSFYVREPIKLMLLELCIAYHPTRLRSIFVQWIFRALCSLDK